MIAALLQLNQSPTTVAPLPACLLCSFKETVHRFVFGAIFVSMPFTVAQSTNFHLATAALPIAILFLNVARLDPFATFFPRTIDSVPGREFLEFAIPRLLERSVE